MNVSNILKLLIRDENFPFIPRSRVGKNTLLFLNKDGVPKMSLSKDRVENLIEYETALESFPIYENTVVISTNVSAFFIFNVLVAELYKEKYFRNFKILLGTPATLFEQDKKDFVVEYHIDSKTSRASILADENDIIFKRGSLFEYEKSEIKDNVLKVYLNEVIEESLLGDFKEIEDYKDVFGKF